MNQAVPVAEQPWRARSAKRDPLHLAEQRVPRQVAAHIAAWIGVTVSVLIQE